MYFSKQFLDIEITLNGQPQTRQNLGQFYLKREVPEVLQYIKTIIKGKV